MGSMSNPVIHNLEYNDGQWLAFTDIGSPNGFPILTQHGMVASIRDTYLFERLVQTGRRVISFARPGYGASSPYEMRDMAEWGEIVAVLANALQLSQFDVLGMSSGAPYSYAIGYELPEKVRTIYIFSGIPALYDQRIAAHWPYPLDRQAALPELQRLAKEIFFPNVSAEDAQRDDVKDSMMNDCFGIAQDLRLRCREWGFTLAEVRPRVWMEHSRADLLIAAQLTAEMLPDCRLEVRESEEHFTEELLDQFLTRIVV
jgi:pimeloyl-ACP methyl ester carboxylesterase